jgi:hypothetical protein
LAVVRRVICSGDWAVELLQEQEEMGEKKKKEKREKKMVVPKGNNRGDYSEFRNKDIRYAH